MARFRRTTTALLPAALLLATGFSFVASGQSILTVAGGGTDDGRLATQIRLLYPWGLALDPDGTIWIADNRDNRVRRVDGATGRISTIAGNGLADSSGDGGPAVQASINGPAGLLHRGNDILVVDREGLRVRRIDLATSTITTFAGGGGSLGDGGPATQAMLGYPAGLAQDSAGNVYIASQSNGRVRRVDAKTGVISTLAGTGDIGDSGDGGPATAAALVPWDLCVDASGNVYVTDWSARKVRRVAAGTGVITTVAGDGSSTVREGELATQSGLESPLSVAVDANGDLWIGDNYSLRKVARATGRLTTLATLSYPVALLPLPDGKLLVSRSQVIPATVDRFDPATGASTRLAGGGTEAIGDGGAATSAVLASAAEVSAAPDGSLLVTESSGQRVRRFRPGGTIQTVAGNGFNGVPLDGAPATSSPLSGPRAAVADKDGATYISNSNLVVRVDGRTGVLTRLAGGGSSEPGDGGPARDAQLRIPDGLALDGDGGLLVSDIWSHRVRRIDFATGVITTVAGTGQPGYSGDGGAATSAQLNSPRGLARDASGNVYVADTENKRIRKIDRATGWISTVAGGGSTPPVGSLPVPGTAASLAGLGSVTSDASGNLTFGNGSRLLRFDAPSGSVVQVGAVCAGSSRSSGDGGPLRDACFNYVFGLSQNAGGDLFVADGFTRIRAVFACVAVAVPSLSSPADGATGTSTGPTLSWSKVAGAFRYDVYLGTTNPPTTAVATDLEATSFTPLNLQPGTRYFWRVVAKGDPFCVPPSSAASGVRSFATVSGCAPPATPVLVSPADGASSVPAPVRLSWEPVPDSESYDIYLGATNPPPLLAFGGTGTSITPLTLHPVPGATYYWSIVAHAACDPLRTSASAVRSFRVAGTGCPAPASFLASAPADGATGVAPDVVLEWTASPNATSYDVYLGPGPSPALYRPGVSSTDLAPGGLSPGVTYHWKVVARTSCDAGADATTAVRSFTVRGTCSTPGPTGFTFLPPGAVGTGQSYVVSWNAASELDPGGGYVVERSASPSFSPLLDVVTTTSLFASFVAPGAGSLYHRVRAIPACDPSRVASWSAPGVVSIVSSKPNVVFSRAPDALVVGVGERLEDRRTVFALENVTSTPVQVIVARQELSSVPFFTIVDPAGDDAAFVTLEPRVPKLFEVRYSGPSSEVAGSYMGLVLVVGTGAGLAVTPYAFVSLRVGSSPDAVPGFRQNGTATEYASFPGFSGDDSTRPPISVDVHNPGSSALELAAEVGPEVWLALEPGWNATPIPPGATRTLRLSTRRTRAPNGSALPRYTYLTLRTKGGTTSRLLVQDNDAPLLSPGRGASAVKPGSSHVVPSVAHVTSALGNTFVSRLTLSNVGGEAVQAELVFTPASSDTTLVDGFDGAATKRATVVVPPNDVVRLSDPLVLLFGLMPPVSGTLEVRTVSERAGFLSVSSSVDAPAAGGGTFGFALPVFRSGEGLRAGSAAAITAVASDAAERTNLILAETTGVDPVVAKVSLVDRDGAPVGSETVTVPRWGQRQLSGVVQRLGGAAGLRAGRLEISVESGGGTLAAVTTVVDNVNDDAAAFGARALDFSVPASRALRPVWARATGTVKSVVPSLVNGYQTFPASAAPFTFRSVMGFTSLSTATALFRMTYYDLASGATIAREVRVAGRKTVEFPNVLEQLFGIGAGVKSQGPLFVESDPNGLLWCRVASSLVSGTIGDSFPVVPIPSEGLTGAGVARVLSIDGLEQSVDRGRGTRSNLILNEVAGKPVTVLVSLYEAGNRSSPVAEREFALQALEKVQLSTVFAELGLDSDERRKDRTNVLCTVRAMAGEGVASGIVTTIDNRTGDTRNLALAPAGAGAGGPTIGF